MFGPLTKPARPVFLPLRPYLRVRSRPSTTMPTFPHQFAGPDDAVLVVYLPLSLNHETADPLREDVHALLPNRDDAGLVLDCSGVSLITSIGIAALLQIDEHCRDHRAPMILAALTPPIRRMLEILKLGAKFATADDLEEAVRRVSRG